MKPRDDWSIDSEGGAWSGESKWTDRERERMKKALDKVRASTPLIKVRKKEK